MSGTAGVGKTALAVHWAHRVRTEFPDGQLYVNLRGYDPDQPLPSGDALTRFLTGLGLAGRDIPLDLDERAARYRTEISTRRILVVLDNASSVDQVRPLLPGTSSAMVVVTSRDSLAGLVAVHGAHRLDLDLLPPSEAITLLGRLIGPRVEAEHDDAAALAERCARLPLALRVAAEMAVSHPAAPLARLVDELADLQRRLDRLDAGGDPRAAVRTVLSWSYQHLPQDTARVFCLLGLHPAADFEVHAAAALADVRLEDARAQLDLLARAHLVQPTGTGRFSMHDLLRAYATEQAACGMSEDDRRAALTRLFDHYLASSAAAMHALYPAEAHRRPHIPPARTAALVFVDADAARAWLDTERPTLVAVAAHTGDHGWPTHAAWLARTLFRYLDGGHHFDALVVHDRARRAAHRTGDQVGEAYALNGLGVAVWQLGQTGQAVDYQREALTLFQRCGDRAGEARAMHNLGGVCAQSGQYQDATDLYLRALDLFRETGDQVGEARALNGLANVDRCLGHHGRAVDRNREALYLFARLGDQAGEASALTDLGLVEQHLGEYARAAEHQQRALDLFRQQGNRAGEADVLDNLGTIHTCLGQPEQAIGYHQRALTVYRETGDADGEAWALNGLGEAVRTAGQTPRALALHTAALDAAIAVGDCGQQARAHLGLGHARKALDDYDSAGGHYRQALALYSELGQPEADDVLAHLAALSPTPGTADADGR